MTEKNEVSETGEIIDLEVEMKVDGRPFANWRNGLTDEEIGKRARRPDATDEDRLRDGMAFSERIIKIRNNTIGEERQKNRDLELKNKDLKWAEDQEGRARTEAGKAKARVKVLEVKIKANEEVIKGQKERITSLEELIKDLESEEYCPICGTTHGMKKRIECLIYHMNYSDKQDKAWRVEGRELREKVKVLSAGFHGSLYNIIMWDFAKKDHIRNITCTRPVTRAQYDAIHRFLDTLFSTDTLEEKCPECGQTGIHTCPDGRRLCLHCDATWTAEPDDKGERDQTGELKGKMVNVDDSIQESEFVPCSEPDTSKAKEDEERKS